MLLFLPRRLWDNLCCINRREAEPIIHGNQCCRTQDFITPVEPPENDQPWQSFRTPAVLSPSRAKRPRSLASECQLLQSVLPAVFVNTKSWRTSYCMNLKCSIWHRSS